MVRDGGPAKRTWETLSKDPHIHGEEKPGRRRRNKAQKDGLEKGTILILRMGKEEQNRREKTTEKERTSQWRRKQQQHFSQEGEAPNRTSAILLLHRFSPGGKHRKDHKKDRSYTHFNNLGGRGKWSLCARAQMRTPDYMTNLKKHGFVDLETQENGAVLEFS